MAYASDLTGDQWVLLEPLLCPTSKRGPKHGGDLRSVVDAMLYVTHTGCQWRFLPAEFGKWTRVWSQFRRWSSNGTWGRVLGALHEQARATKGRKESRPSMVVIDSQLARGASRGGLTFHDRGGPYGMTKGAKRVIAVDVTGLPLVARVVPASTSEQVCVERLLDDMFDSGQASRLELVLVDRGTSKTAAKRLSHKSDGTNHSWTTTDGGCSVQSVTRGALRSPTDVSAGRAGWRSRSRTRLGQRQAGCNSRASQHRSKLQPELGHRATRRAGAVCAVTPFEHNDLRWVQRRAAS
jgi:putative transposase